jgi:MFS family permease
MKALKSVSLATLIVICGFIFAYRISNVSEKEIAWDILGYYLYLPSTFIYDQPMLNDYTWLKEINAEKDLTGTLYQVSTNDEGEPMYFFLMGMSMLYLPFFLIGHLLAGPLGFPADGFSMPYQYALVIGGIIYAIIGLIYLRKNLRHFFSEKITALIMIILVFGTNYIHHNTLKNLETVNMLFMLVNIILWNTIKWHENQKLKYLMAVGLASALAALVKPSEVFVVLIPLLWNVTGWQSFKDKLRLFLSNFKPLLIVIAASFLLVLPQLLYWYFKTGHILYDSYKNPGVGLDIFSPHIIEVLFSYRKGWFLYTPVMIFAVTGFYFMFKENRKIFYASAFYFLISFYIISSWTEWWYGAAYSGRPMITLYPVLAISLGYFLEYMLARKFVVRLIFGIVVIFFIFMNQFQWWQLRHYILDPYRTTKEYYWSIFLKTKITNEDRARMSIYRDFSGKMELSDMSPYMKFIILDDNFEDTGRDHVFSDESDSFYRLQQGQEFYLMFESEYKELTSKDHAWVKARIDVRYPDGFEGDLPCFVMTMERQDGSYRYFAPEMRTSSAPGEWVTLQWDYLTPEIRNTRDRFKCYIWNRGKSSFDIDNVRLELYKKK